VERMEGRALVVEASGARALLAVREQARRRRVMAALRRLLLENRSGTTTYVYVNRQAAYVGLISFVEEEGESPLGPIILRIESSDVDSTIDWLVPEEEALRRQREGPPLPCQVGAREHPPGLLQQDARVRVPVAEVRQHKVPDAGLGGHPRGVPGRRMKVLERLPPVGPRECGLVHQYVSAPEEVDEPGRRPRVARVRYGYLDLDGVHDILGPHQPPPHAYRGSRLQGLPERPPRDPQRLRPLGVELPGPPELHPVSVVGRAVPPQGRPHGRAAHAQLHAVPRLVELQPEREARPHALERGLDEPPEPPGPQELDLPRPPGEAQAQEEPRHPQDVVPVHVGYQHAQLLVGVPPAEALQRVLGALAAI